jgi:hypothetical protein
MGMVSWLQIESKKIVKKHDSNKDSLSYGQPNIYLDKAFFWLRITGKPRTEEDKDIFIKFNLTNSDSKFIYPAVPIDAGYIVCDYKNIRCIKPFNTRENEKTKPFIYGILSSFKEINCRISSLNGWHDIVYLTSNGRHMITSFAPTFDAPRKIVLVTFSDQQCEPSNIQSIIYK